VRAQVVGDLAQFMVQNNLTEASIVDQADQLSIPNRCDCLRSGVIIAAQDGL